MEPLAPLRVRFLGTRWESGGVLVLVAAGLIAFTLWMAWSDFDPKPAPYLTPPQTPAGECRAACWPRVSRLDRDAGCLCATNSPDTWAVPGVLPLPSGGVFQPGGPTLREKAVPSSSSEEGTRDGLI